MQKIDRNHIYGIKPFTHPLVQPRIPLTDNFMTQKIGHTYFKRFDPFPFQKKYLVQDFIFESSQTTGAINVFDKVKQFSLNTTNEYVLNFYPDMDKTFVVKLPVGATKGFFSIYVGRELFNRQLAMPGIYDLYTSNIQFGRLNGIPPTLTYSSFGIQNGFNGSIYFNVTGEFSADFSFDYLSLQGTYPSRMVLPFVEDYSLFSYAMPAGIQSNETLAFAMFGYETDKATDPGPFIKLKKN